MAHEKLSTIWREAWRPPDRQPAWAWAEEHIRSIPYSPMPGRFRIENSPQIREVLDAITDPKVRLVSIIAAVQSSKTTAPEVALCYSFLPARNFHACFRSAWHVFGISWEWNHRSRFWFSGGKWQARARFSRHDPLPSRPAARSLGRAVYAQAGAPPFSPLQKPCSAAALPSQNPSFEGADFRIEKPLI